MTRLSKYCVLFVFFFLIFSNFFKFIIQYKDFYRKEIEVDNDPAILEILDTAGTEQFASMRDLYIRNGQGFLLVFSLTSKQSFHDIKQIRDQILRVKNLDKIPIAIAANKYDNMAQREVTPDEISKLSAEWKIPILETSAKLPRNVNDVFAEIVRQMDLQPKRIQSRSSCCSLRKCCIIS
jgi:small GTP-binding protein